MPLPATLSGASVHLVGIKGTGMSALAEVLSRRGADLSGSDVAEIFYTDRLLAAIGLRPKVGFSADNLPKNLDAVIYSAAYDPDSNPELLAAAERKIPMLSYSEALGALSQEACRTGAPRIAVAGVHGKTTTTALLGTIMRHLGVPGTVVVGSAVPSFGGSATYNGGSDALVAETCEYRRNFLSFSPSMLIVTSVEADHLDYFRDYDDILRAFVEFGTQLSEGGTLIYCADDPGAVEVASRVAQRRGDIRRISYGFTRKADFSVDTLEMDHETTAGGVRGIQRFLLSGYPQQFTLSVPGRHMVQNAVGALATLFSQPLLASFALNHASVAQGLSTFAGTARRSEHLGSAGGIQFIDDYGHHPTSIEKTLEAYRDFYRADRLVVDFMSHTYSRTAALLDRFARAFTSADIVILHKIYASAREHFSGTIDGKDLADAVAAHHPAVHYVPEVLDALPLCRELLRPGDLFVTLGAGNNWVLGRELFSHFSRETVGTR